MIERLRSLSSPRYAFLARFTTNDALRLLEDSMPRKGKQNGNADNNSGRFRDSQPNGGKFRFVNITLSDDDLAELELSEATLEYLVARLLDIYRESVSFSIRHVDARKSHCVTLIGPDCRDDRNTVGVSSFAATERDACLVAVYKFDILLDGDWRSINEFDASPEQRRRFR